MIKFYSYLIDGNKRNFLCEEDKVEKLLNELYNDNNVVKVYEEEYDGYIIKCECEEKYKFKNICILCCNSGIRQSYYF